MMTTWRPHQIIRPIAVGIVRRDDRILVMAVRDDSGELKGWRPLGGTIEFGERAADGLRREFLEELGKPIREPLLLTVMENLYSHHGTRGHEIVFVFETAFADNQACSNDKFPFDDGGVANEAEWVQINRFVNGSDQLFPAGLIEAIKDRS
jgi:ADP-ribose pyrophosphatase YjhB (NUDIX family)